MQPKNTAEPTEGKRVNVLVPVHVHKEMSKRMVDEDKTVTQIVVAAITFYLHSPEPQRGKRAARG